MAWLLEMRTLLTVSRRRGLRGHLGTTVVEPRAAAVHLDANSWQRGLCWSFGLVSALLWADDGHLRAMRLLPFAAAARGSVGVPESSSASCPAGLVFTPVSVSRVSEAHTGVDRPQATRHEQRSPRCA